MKFHIVITNNETGEVIKDKNADAIIASIHTEESIDVLSVACCNGFALVETIAGLMHVLEDNKKDYPEIYKRAEKYKKNQENKGE